MYSSVMKGLKMSLVAVLLLGIFLHHSHSARAPNAGQDCCNTYIKGAIPLTKLVTWYKTSTNCRKEAIVFITVQKRSICANPTEKWVNKAIRFLANDSKRATSNPAINSSGPQNSNLLSSTPLSPQTPLNNSAQLNHNSTSPINSSHLKLNTSTTVFN